MSEAEVRRSRDGLLGIRSVDGMEEVFQNRVKLATVKLYVLSNAVNERRAVGSGDMIGVGCDDRGVVVETGIAKKRNKVLLAFVKPRQCSLAVVADIDCGDNLLKPLNETSYVSDLFFRSHFTGQRSVGLTRTRSATAGESERSLQWKCLHKVKRSSTATSDSASPD
jgi:hypothetical protein